MVEQAEIQHREPKKEIAKKNPFRIILIPVGPEGCLHALDCIHSGAIKGECGERLESILKSQTHQSAKNTPLRSQGA